MRGGYEEGGGVSCGVGGGVSYMFSRACTYLTVVARLSWKGEGIMVSLALVARRRGLREEQLAVRAVVGLRAWGAPRLSGLPIVARKGEHLQLLILIAGIIVLFMPGCCCDKAVRSEMEAVDCRRPYDG